MAGISDWIDMMPLTVTVRPFASRTSYGVASYGAAVEYRARLNYNDHYVRGANGEEVLARGVAWLATSAVISTNDEITMPDGSKPQILNAIGETDESGAQLYRRLDFG